MPERLDQFYTNRQVSKRIVDSVKKHFDDFDIILEPSAGDGSFFQFLPVSKRLGIDLDPKSQNIEKKDFFHFLPEKNKSYFTIGNPPFGKNSSLAVNFFNHAATFSQYIAFIVPRTFRKDSIQNKLDLKFHLISEELLPQNSFYTSSKEKYDVPTVFQIWKKSNTLRDKKQILKNHPDFTFLGSDDREFTNVVVTVSNNPSFFGEKDSETYIMKDEELQQIKLWRKKYPRFFSSHNISKAKKQLFWKTKPDFAWRRAGGRAGELFDDYNRCPTEGFEFIKTNNPEVKKVFQKMWDDYWNPTTNIEKDVEKWDTAGQPSISKHELICRYIKTKNLIT